ncbi:MAG TPA: amino acid permease [Cyclobacteriaceae bacterium]|nr:amino acid permease [Cyclobacteriaceae bacterium]
MEDKQGQLVRSLGLFSVFLLTVSSTVGSGIYKKVGPMSADLGSPSLVILCWVLAGCISICGALSNAEVAGMLADSGGEYAYFKKIYNKFFAFLVGWANFTAIRSASAASVGYVFAMSFNSLVPLPELPDSIASINIFGIFTPFDNFGVKAFTILLIVGLSCVHYVGLKFGDGLNRIVTLTVIVSIFLVIILGLTMGGGSWENFSTPSKDYVEQPWWSGSFIKLIFMAMLASFWAYEGWSSVGYLGGEIKNANRTLPLALIMGVFFVMLIYCTINFTYLYILPIDNIIDTYRTSTNTIAAVVVVEHFLGGAGMIFMLMVIALTTFGSTNATLLTPPRLYYAMAKEGLFFKGAAYIHPKYNTPSTALIYQAVVSSVLVLSGSFDQLTDMLVFASFIVYGATAAGVFVLRYKMPDAPRPYRVWGYPVVPAIFIIFCITLVGITIVSKPREALLGLGLIASGIPFYLYWKSKK